MTAYQASWISTACGVLAASFWFWSACVKLPRSMAESTIGDTPNSVIRRLKRQSGLSAIAAAFAALSMIAQGLALHLAPR